MLAGILFLDRLSYNTSVQEHGYLNRYSLNELTVTEINQMYLTKGELLKSHIDDQNNGLKLGKQSRTDFHCHYYSNKNNYTDYTNYYTTSINNDGKGESDKPYSCWSSEHFDDTPQVFITLSNILSDIKNIEVGFNRFLYSFSTSGKNGAIPGHSILFRLNCMRCMPRGATLLIATVNTENFEEDLTSVLLSVTALRHFSTAKYLSQNIFLLVTMRQLTFSAGTRQFLQDYFNSPYFKLRSGTIHNALVLDLGCNNCSSYLISYEGIDGWLPNQDIVNIFVEIANVESLVVNVRGMWTSIFRMAVNVDRTRHHVPLLERNINAFSLICKYTSYSESKVKNNEELLLKSLILTLRNQNNLDTVLERSFNFYFFVSPTSFVSISVYSLVVPLLFIRPISKIILYPFFDNLQMFLGISLVFFNIFVGSIPAYFILLKLVKKNSGNPFNSQIIQRIKFSLLVLVLSYFVVFLFNSLLFYKTSNLFGDDYTNVDYLSKDLLLPKRNNSILNKFKFQNLIRVLKHFKLKFMNKFRKNDNNEDNSDTTNTGDTAKNVVHNSMEIMRTKEIMRCMGYYWYILRLPDRLPSIELFLLYSVYFVSLSFLLGLSVLNWSLSFLLSIVLLVPFNVISTKSVLRGKITASISTIYFIIFTIFFYPFEGKVGIARAFLFENSKKCFKILGEFFSSGWFRKNDITNDLGDKFSYISEHVFGSKTQWINSRGNLFLLRKIYSASENHLLFGSYNIVVLLFMFGIISHTLFLNLLLLIKRSHKVKSD
ncbi:uncharacterized protein TA04335 [Theileria annulata]|uniref:Gaa1-like, GPI transamidase component n=1 Tax=Theileria annulata TaxID=5874 RepID=Q4UC42_THEAN|nr:uncharacterized protein TA04335 [Theileria annulata]CAI75609.1 hypothetical protein, conserved [Theileria annulata]|eukprot:XP_955085.1 hypothetical protein, conserved [Theileria annulata]